MNMHMRASDMSVVMQPLCACDAVVVLSQQHARQTAPDPCRGLNPLNIRIVGADIASCLWLAAFFWHGPLVQVQRPHAAAVHQLPVPGWRLCCTGGQLDLQEVRGDGRGSGQLHSLYT